MNIVEALKIAKEQGKKVKPVDETAVYLVYVKSKDKYDMRNIETGRHVKIFKGATAKGILSDWEVVEEKPSRQTQYKIDSIKFQITRYCKNIECSNSECELYRKCVDKVRVDNGYSPKVNLLDDWSLKEIVEAYHILKEAGEI